MPTFPGRRDYPNVGMCGGLLASILTLLQTPFVHFLYMHDRRQATNQSSFMGFFFLPHGPLLPLSRPYDEYTVSTFSFSQLVEVIRRDFQGLPALYYHIFGCVVWSACQTNRTSLRTAESTGETCPPLLLASCIKFFVRQQW